MSYQGLTRNELELTIVCAAMTDTESAVLMQELRVDDFAVPPAQSAHAAILAVLSGHEEVNAVLVHRRLSDAGKRSHAQQIIDHMQLHNADCVPIGHLRQYVQHLIEVSTRKRVEDACQRIVRLARDPDTTLQALHEQAPTLLAEALARSVPHEAVVASDVLLQLSDEMRQAEDRGEVLEPILETGLAPLDTHKVGGCAGEVIILAAASSMGKSALGLQIARAWAEQGEVYYWSGEMPARQLARRIASQVAYRPKGQLTSTLVAWSASQAVDRLYLDDEKGINVDRLIQKLTIYKLLHPGMRAAVIDYLGLLCDNDYKAVSRTSKLIKAAAGKLNIPILLLCQLKRLGDRADKTPQMDDLRESGQIEQDADKILMLHRPGYYDPDKDQSEALLYVRKYRDGERNVGVRLRWEGPVFSFFPPSAPATRTRPEPELRDDDDQPRFPTWTSEIETEDIPL